MCFNSIEEIKFWNVSMKKKINEAGNVVVESRAMPLDLLFIYPCYESSL